MREGRLECSNMSRDALYKSRKGRLRREVPGESWVKLARKAVCSVRFGWEFSEQTANCKNTHVRKDTPGRHPGRLQVANLESSKRCSCMPVIRLVRLRRALGGVIPSFDPIPTAQAVMEVGRHGNGAEQVMAQ